MTSTHSKNSRSRTISRIKPLIIALGLITVNSLASTAAAFDKEDGGMGIGLLVGGAIAGPPGAIIGAIGGRWVGYHDTQQELTIAAISSELTEKENQLTKIQTELSVAETELGNALDQINQDKRTASLEYLQKGLTTTVYFRTGESELPESNSSQLFELAQTLKDFPELQITMEGHADIRGVGEYNQQLSESRIQAVQQILQNAGIPERQINCEAYGETEAMANNGDRENYIFDRRVSIHLSLDSTS